MKKRKQKSEWKIVRELGPWGCVALAFTLLGAFNIGVMGVFDYNVLKGVFGRVDIIFLRAVYVLIGACALWFNYQLRRLYT